MPNSYIPPKWGSEHPAAYTKARWKAFLRSDNESEYEIRWRLGDTYTVQKYPIGSKHGKLMCYSCDNPNLFGPTSSGEYHLFMHLKSCLAPSIASRKKGTENAVKRNNLQQKNVLHFFQPNKKTQTTTPTVDTTLLRESVPPENTPSTSGSVSTLTESPCDTTSTRASTSPCIGYVLSIRNPPTLHYPHSIGIMIPTVQKQFWFDPRTQTVRSVLCTGIGSNSSGKSGVNVCLKCSSLMYNETLENIVERSNNDNIHRTTIRNVYLTEHQTSLRLATSRKSRNMFQIQFLQKLSVVKNAMSRLDDLKNIVVQISENRISRVKQILGRALREKRSVAHIINILEDANSNKYCAKRFDDEDLDAGILMLKLGGRTLCYAHSRFAGGPSITTIKRLANMPKYYTYASEIVEETMLKNFENFVFRLHSDADPPLKKSLHVLMIDDIKGEKRIRLDPDDGCIRGLCYHCFEQNISTNICCEEDCYTIKKALDDGKIHPATEITNVAIGAIRENNYAPMVVATSAGCQQKDPIERSLKLVQSAINIYVSDKRGQDSMGLLTTVQPGYFITFPYSI